MPGAFRQIIELRGPSAVADTAFVGLLADFAVAFPKERKWIRAAISDFDMGKHFYDAHKSGKPEDRTVAMSVALRQLKDDGATDEKAQFIVNCFTYGLGWNGANASAPTKGKQTTNAEKPESSGKSTESTKQAGYLKAAEQGNAGGQTRLSLKYRFEPGETLQTSSRKTVKIIKFIDEGEQGAVYEVDYGGQRKALKWYHTGIFGTKENAATFYNNLQRNINRGAPSKDFLWPLDLTEETRDSFGCIMDLRPDGYVDFGRFLLGKATFSSFSANVEACINIVNGFRKLHSIGLSYQALNDGSFFINPENGAVILCDNDNVAGDFINLGILGNMRYMAPEIVTGSSSPSVVSDRFSLAVILFWLIFFDHPLEGEMAVKVPRLTVSKERELYGSDPVFVMDPYDSRNRPVKNVHVYIINMWPLMPDYLQQMFIDSFSKDAMTGTLQRKTDRDWIDVLVRLRSELCRCPHCGQETFVRTDKAVRCNECNKIIKPQGRLEIGRMSLPVIAGVKLYKCHTSSEGTTEIENAQIITGEIVPSKTTAGVLGIKNLTTGQWKEVKPDGTKKDGKSFRIEPGLKVEFGKPPIPGHIMSASILPVGKIVPLD
jgi:serine/threonine protein kinase